MVKKDTVAVQEGSEKDSRFRELWTSARQALRRRQMKAIPAVADQKCRYCDERIEVGHYVVNDKVAWCHARCVLRE
eukprot:14463612-Alexandrium_andersonii.AAC.1